MAPLVTEHGLQTRGLSTCDTRAQLPCGMWHPPRPGIEPVSLELAGGFLTTGPPGKSFFFFFNCCCGCLIFTYVYRVLIKLLIEGQNANKHLPANKEKAAT